MLKVSQSDSFPGARYVAADPISESEFCLARSVQLIADVCDAGGYPYTIRMGKIFFDMDAAEYMDASKGVEPAPTGMMNTDVEDGIANAVTDADFGGETGKVWIADNATWDSAEVKVEQTVDVWTDEDSDFTAVQGGLPVSPPAAYLFVENACGRRNAVGFEVAIVVA